MLRRWLRRRLHLLLRLLRLLLLRLLLLRLLLLWLLRRLLLWLLRLRLLLLLRRLLLWQLRRPLLRRVRRIGWREGRAQPLRWGLEPRAHRSRRCWRTIRRQRPGRRRGGCGSGGTLASVC